MKRFLAVLLCGLSLLGCRADAIDAMARTTALVEQQYATAYENGAEYCRESSDSWAEYDRCMEPWEAGADAVLVLRDTTLALDATQGRRQLKDQACAWFRALAVVDATAPVDIPAAQAGLRSKWSRKC